MKKERKTDRIRLLIMTAAGALGIAAALYLCLSPQFRRQEVHKCATTNENWQTGPLAETVNAVQEFIPQQSGLMQIAVWVNRQEDRAAEGVLQMRVYDGEGQDLAVCSRPVAELMTNNWEWFDVEAELQAGQSYYFSLGVQGGGEVCPTAVYRPMHLDRIEENVRYFYGGELIEGGSAACQYRYRLPLAKTEICIYVTCCLFFAVAAGELVCRAVVKNRG